MVSPINPYLSGDFTPDNASNYHLLLAISEHEFSYLVTENDALLAFGKQLPIAQLATPLSLGSAAHLNYKQVVAGIAPRDFSIVPNELFDSTKAADIAKYMNVAEGDKIFSQHLDSSNHILFNCSKELEARMAENYSAVMINFLYKGWLQAIARRQPFNNTLYIDIKKECVRIASFVDEKLRLYNRYAIADNNDLVYYVALVAGELGVSQNDATIIASGGITAGDTAFNALKEFFRQVEINKIGMLQHIPAEIEPQHVLALSALQLCVS